MNADKQDFEALQRLLKLKRHEQPPPRYFNDFSTRVLNRIQAGRPADRESFLERLTWESPWLQKVLSALQGKPIVAGALGAAACVLLVGGAIYSESSEPNPTMAEFGAVLPHPGVQPTSPVFGNEAMLAVNSTNPATSLSGASIFDGITIKAQPVSFRPGGN